MRLDSTLYYLPSAVLYLIIKNTTYHIMHYSASFDITFDLLT